MWINKKELLSLSAGIRASLDGQPFDPRDHREGTLSILKNDIYTMIRSGQEQRTVLENDKEHLREYLSDISHQLKTPVSSILLMTELMTDAPKEAQRDFLFHIKKEVRHMEWLLAALLKMAKMDASAVDFQREETAVSELLHEAQKSMDIVLDIRNQTLRLQNDLHLFCDKKWTAEALLNLIKNASECSPENAEILIDCGENPLYSWISVTDAGEGLKKEQIARLFRRFESAQKENGCGIGLPLALSIMRAQNGDIEVSPGGNGSGATFLVKFYQESPKSHFSDLS
ncbi:MAG: HAMP domain-containing histidine kinase [Bacteroidales bacterium]|nr:HAMP domain-containing histidine kinase [Bacteroidales bacterium]MCM1416114.1 HAMP domain-containing histidine kinase [bacterium]MCM1422846.1 HAMP domain-containing histidine kinase [bacterium]